jgi:hypothetical protein
VGGAAAVAGPSLPAPAAHGWVVILVIGLAVGLAAAPRWVARRTWGPAGIGVVVVEPTVVAARPPVRPETLSTPELCLAWRRSYFALLDARPDPPATSSSGSADACSTSLNGATTSASRAGSRRVPVPAATRPAT